MSQVQTWQRSQPDTYSYLLQHRFQHQDAAANRQFVWWGGSARRQSKFGGFTLSCVCICGNALRGFAVYLVPAFPSFPRIGEEVFLIQKLHRIGEKEQPGGVSSSRLTADMNGKRITSENSQYCRWNLESRAVESITQISRYHAPSRQMLVTSPPRSG